MIENGMDGYVAALNQTRYEGASRTLTLECMAPMPAIVLALEGISHGYVDQNMSPEPPLHKLLCSTQTRATLGVWFCSVAA